MADRDLILAGKNLLVVDDEPLLAYDLSDILSAQGGTVVGPYHSLEDAMTGLRAALTRIDCALLDIQIGSDIVWPLAEQLEEAGIPFFFISAQCGTRDVPAQFAHRPCLQKPASEDSIRVALMSMLFG